MLVHSKTKVLALFISQPCEQNEHGINRFQPSRSRRSREERGRAPHKGQTGTVITTGARGICAARNSAYGCRNARARNWANAPTGWSYLPPCCQYASRLEIQESEGSRDI